MTRNESKELPLLSINMIHHKTFGSKIPMGSVEFDIDTQIPDNGNIYIYTLLLLLPLLLLLSLSLLLSLLPSVFVSIPLYCMNTHNNYPVCI